jgi:hypothetical protein
MPPLSLPGPVERRMVDGSNRNYLAQQGGSRDGVNNVVASIDGNDCVRRLTDVIVTREY